MSETGQQASGWWLASDGKWYPPETAATDRPPPPTVVQTVNPILRTTRFCVTCGNGLVATAAICPRCGTPVAGSSIHSALGGKSKSTAVVLAVFLSFWSFLYTYRRAPWKFWLGLGMSVGGYFVAVAGSAATNGDGINPGAVIWVLFGVGVWIWAIIDRSKLPSQL
jgi:hypothetical protein